MGRRRYRARQSVSRTSLELAVAAYLDSLGLAYVEQAKIGSCHVDFLLPDHAVVVEANGCYWHGCIACGYGRKWKKRKRDGWRYDFLRSQGYRVIICWEHEFA